ncbi:MAG: hypothetical protein WEB06_15720 [Actinomycetota bacterium]
MRKGVSKTRRLSAVVAVTMVAMLAMGTGANAALPTISVRNYVAQANASVLDVKLALPTVLNTVLGAADIANPIEQSISFSRALGQVDKLGDKGHGLGQMFDGTLNTTLETLSTALLGKKLPKAFAPLALVEKVVHEDLLALDVQGLVKVGISEVNASSTLNKLADGTRAIKSTSDSKLAGITVGLTPALVDTLKGVLQPVLNETDAPDTGIVDTLNGLLTPVEQLVETTLGVPVNLDLPKIGELLSQPLISIGLIETKSATDFASNVRNATGFSRMVDIDLFGKGENALVHIDALTTKTFAQVGVNAADRKATAIHEIAGLRVLNNTISLIKGDQLAINVNGKEIALTDLAGIDLDAVLDQLNGLLFDTLGLKINVLGTSKSVNATTSQAKARTIEVGIAPNIAGNVLFDLSIAGPGSDVFAQANIAGSSSPPAPHPTTGVATNAYLLAGPALIGMAVLVRRFALSK